MRQTGIISLLLLLSACDAPDVVIGARGAQTESPAVGSGLAAGNTAAHVLDAAVSETTGSTGKVAVSGSDAGSHALEPRSPGCGKPASDVELADAALSYLIDLPNGYDARIPYPLLLGLRAAEGSAADFRASLDMASAVGTAAIIVYPECPRGRTTWDVPGDVDYLVALRSQLLERYCVDRTRVFVLGHAQGGWLASAAACSRSDLLRGAALFAGTEAMQPCRGSLAIFVAQGTRDPVFSLRAGRHTRDFWANVNGCDTALARAAEPASCEDYACMAAPTRYCEYEGGHELPSFAASSAWSFFRAL